jgi:hypothetical protein
MRRSFLAVVIALGACAPRTPAEVRGASARPVPPLTAPSAAPAPAPALPSGCAPPSGSEPPVLLAGTPLVVLCHGLYADPATTTEERAALQRWYGESLRGLATVFGPAKADPPVALSCKTDACALHFSGPSRRSRARMEPHPMVVINGLGTLTKGTMLHEMVHVEIARRMGKTPRRALPTWFDEGVATFVGDNAPCAAGAKRVAIDDLRRLDQAYAWEGFTEMTGKMAPAYCQARDEIAAWAERRGRPALVEVVDAVAAGRKFDDVYGSLVTALPPESFDRSLDGRFALDENIGTNAVDQSGRSHIATLMGGAIWTTGHAGAAVKVIGGSHVRADGFADFGVPDAPFSIALWAKPLANAKVLVHASMNASGGGGWCVPVLGHDAAGHLVAEVNFDDDPKAFLTATGPILALHTWSHVVATWSAGDGVRLYVNGALAASAPPRTAAERHRTAPASPAYLFFGSSNAARCWSHGIELGDWNGALDELRVYDYALGQAEVASEMVKR